jgi:hypothetical protein
VVFAATEAKVFAYPVGTTAPGALVITTPGAAPTGATTASANNNDTNNRLIKIPFLVPTLRGISRRYMVQMKDHFLAHLRETQSPPDGSREHLGHPCKHSSVRRRYLLMVVFHLLK